MRAVLRHLSNFGVGPQMTIETRRKLILSNQLAYLTFALLFTMNLFFMFSNGKFEVVMLLSLISIFSILSVPFLNKLGHYSLTAFLLSALTPIFTVIFTIYSHRFIGKMDVTDYFFPRLLLLGELVLPLILIDSKHNFTLVIGIAINLACIFGFDYACNHFGVPFDPLNVSLEAYQKINFVIIFPCLIVLFGFYFLHRTNHKYETAILGLNVELKQKNKQLSDSNEEIASQRDQIVETNKALVEKNEEIASRNEEILEKNSMLEHAKQEIESIHKNLTDSILYAERIQHAILDKESLPSGYFRDDFILFKPKSIVSGDFYFYRPHIIDGKNCMIVAAADCTGHGVPGGFMSMLAIALINEVLQKPVVKNASQILDLLREEIKIAMKQTGKESEQKDGLDIALCVYWPDEKRIDFAGARNPVFIVDKDKGEQLIKGDRQPIGIHLKEFPFTNHSISFKGGEMIYLFSDGFADQFGGIGKKLLLKFFKQNLVDISGKSGIDQKHSIEALMQSWMKKSDGASYEQTDDMLLVGFRIP